MSKFSLKNKIAIITGGGSGIGESIGKVFAEQGAYVNILDYHVDQANKVLEAIEKNGGKGKSISCDVSNRKQVIEVVDEIAKPDGIDILVNNAGVSHIGNLDNTSEADFDRIFSVNVKGYFHVMMACVKHMKEKGGGAILNMASIAASIGIPDRFAYSASKGAVKAMTLSVAVDYLKDNIRCNSISPARVHTPFVDDFIARNYPGKEKETFDKLSKTQPIGRMGKPDEIAHLALYLCSDEASFITGNDYLIDGGFINLAV